MLLHKETIWKCLQSSIWSILHVFLHCISFPLSLSLSLRLFLSLSLSPSLLQPNQGLIDCKEDCKVWWCPSSPWQSRFVSLLSSSSSLPASAGNCVSPSVAFIHWGAYLSGDWLFLLPVATQPGSECNVNGRRVECAPCNWFLFLAFPNLVFPSSLCNPYCF